MLLTPHTLVGTAIALSIPNPIIAIPTSLIFHFLGDLMPHWDFFTNNEREKRFRGWVPIAIMADMSFGVAIGVGFTLYAYWFLGGTLSALNVFACGIASVLPDILTGPSIYMENVHPFFNAVHKLQSKLQTSANPPLGIITQLVVIIVSLYLILHSLV